MIAIMGAGGQTGGAVLRRLRAAGAEVRAIGRNAGRLRAAFGPDVAVAEADAADPARLAAAFAGARAAYVLCAPSPVSPDVMAEAEVISRGVAAALRMAGVPHAVALSSEGAHLPAGSGVVRVLNIFERTLDGAAPALTLLRATYFAENLAAGFGPARAAGVLPSLLQPLDRRVRMVSVADIAAVATEALLGPAPAGRRILDLVGPAEVSPDEAAAVLAGLLGRPVAAIAPPREAWEGEMVAAGLGADYARLLAELADAINADALGFEPGAGTLRRGTTGLAEALRALLPAA